MMLGGIRPVRTFDEIIIRSDDGIELRIKYNLTYPRFTVLFYQTEEDYGKPIKDPEYILNQTPEIITSCFSDANQERAMEIFNKFDRVKELFTPHEQGDIMKFAEIGVKSDSFDNFIQRMKHRER